MKKISPEELRDWINTDKTFLLVDVREIFEREAYHIGGVHIPMGEIMQRKSELPEEQDVVFYCEKGIRSMIAITRLEMMGYKNLYNLTGGMTAWKKL